MTTRNSGETKIALDQLFRLLADKHRRYALYYLDATASDTVTLDEVADYVAERTQTSTEEQEWASGTAHERIRTRLHHNHLPRLAKTGLIDYDARSQTVRNWGKQPLTTWAQHGQHELPKLRSLFCTSVSR